LPASQSARPKIFKDSDGFPTNEYVIISVPHVAATALLQTSALFHVNYRATQQTNLCGNAPWSLNMGAWTILSRGNNSGYFRGVAKLIFEGATNSGEI